jgi:hypothetical protein
MLRANEFDSRDAAHFWGEDRYGPWVEDLPDAQMQALLHYQNVPVINAPLRGLEEFDDAGLRQVALMDEAIADAVVPEDVIAWRLVDQEAIGPLNVGSVFRDDGYTSTSLSRDVIEDFDPENWDMTQAVYRFKIFVPRGYNGAYLGEGFEEFFSQEELLLKRGSRFRVRGIDHGTGIINLEAIP